MASYFKQFIFTFLIFFFLFPLCGDPITIHLENSISPEMAQVYDQQLVTVKGFLYPHPSGYLVLGHQPNLKSCCIGSETLVNQQLVIKEKLPLSLTTVQVQGVFHLDSKVNQKGEKVHFYLLNKAELISAPQKKFHFFWMFIGMIIICIGFKIIVKSRFT